MDVHSNLYSDNLDSDLSIVAQELFIDKGYTVIKNYLDSEIVEKLRSSCINNDILMEPLKDGSKINKKDFHNFYVKYFYINRCIHQIPKFFNFLIETCNLRNKIALQKESDLIVYEYSKRKKINNLNDLSFSQLSHSFIRLAWYKDGNGQNEHIDNVGELQCIIPLTEKLKDYNQGGLFVKTLNSNEYIDVDLLVQPGDLVILNSYRCTHRVDPVSKSDNQVGRLHLFIPVIPEWAFARKKYYFFKKNRFKLYFTDKTLNCYIKFCYFLEHILTFNFLKQSMDSATFKKESSSQEKKVLNLIFNK